MKNKILTIYGSLNSVPSPEGAAPAKVIQQTVESLDDNRFKVLSNWNVKLEGTTYDRSIFLHVKQNWIDKLFLIFLKLRFNYKKRKELFVTAQDSQLLFFISVCRFLLFNKYRQTVVHAAPGLVVMIKMYLPMVDIIFYHHGTSLHSKLSKMQWEDILKKTDYKIIGVNQRACDKANEFFDKKIKENQYVKVANGIKKPVDVVESNDKSNKFKILFTGRICKEKGVLNLIKAIEIVCKTQENIELIIVGGAGTKRNLKAGESYIELCKKYVKEHNLPVVFTGYKKQEKVYKYLKKAQIVVLPTNSKLSEEGMSLSLLEAMAFGKALIATESGGNAEIVKHNYNGYIVYSDEDYYIELADRIKELIVDKEKLKLFSDNSKKLFNKEHTVEAMGNNFIQALKHFNYV